MGDPFPASCQRPVYIGLDRIGDDLIRPDLPYQIHIADQQMPVFKRIHPSPVHWCKDQGTSIGQQDPFILIIAFRNRDNDCMPLPAEPDQQLPPENPECIVVIGKYEYFSHMFYTFSSEIIQSAIAFAETPYRSLR